MAQNGKQEEKETSADRQTRFSILLTHLDYIILLP